MELGIEIGKMKLGMGSCSTTRSRYYYTSGKVTCKLPRIMTGGWGVRSLGAGGFRVEKEREREGGFSSVVVVLVVVVPCNEPRRDLISGEGSGEGISLSLSLSRWLTAPGE